MGILYKIACLLGSPEWGLDEERLRAVLAKSPYEIDKYTAQGMTLAAYFIIDPRIPVGDRQTLPPANLVKAIDGEHGPKGRRRAEDWIINDALRARGDKSGCVRLRNIL